VSVPDEKDDRTKVQALLREIAAALERQDFEKAAPLQRELSELVAEGCWIPSADALDRIVNATWPGSGNWPSWAGKWDPEKKDRDKLAADLQTAWSKWQSFTVLDCSADARKRGELFGLIVKAGKSFKKALLSPIGDQYAAREIAFSFPDAAEFETFLVALDRVIKAADDARQSNSGAWVRLHRPRKEWFAAEILAYVYEHNFRRQPGLADTTRPEGADGGPFGRFAIQVMKEMGIPLLAPGTIVRALKDVAAGRQRPEGRSSVQFDYEAWERFGFPDRRKLPFGGW
jgi:hypothetical protein